MTTTPDCSPLRDDLKAFRDNELPLGRRLAVRSHLARCASCREEMEHMQQLENDLNAAEGELAAPLDAGLRARLLRAVPDLSARPGGEAPAEPPEGAPLWRRQPLWVFGSGAVAALVIAVAFVPMFTASQQAMIAAAPQAASVAPAEREDRSRDAASSGAHLEKPATGGSTAVVPLDVPLPSAPVARQAQAKSAAPRPEMAMKSRRADEAMPGGFGGAGFPGGPPAAPSPSMPPAAGNPPSRFSVAQKPSPALPTIIAPLGASANAVGERAADAAKEKENVPSSLSLSALAERQVHKEASIHVAVEKLEASSDSVEQMVKSAGGFVASNQLSTGTAGDKSAELTVRVPVDAFEDTLARIGKLGEIVTKNVMGEDLTEKVSDTRTAEQVLADDLRKSEAALRKTPALPADQRGEKVREVRALRLQLAQTRNYAEQLRKLSALATIQVQLSEKPKKAADENAGGFLGDLRETNRTAMLAFQSAVRVPLVLLIWILAFSPIWVPLLIAYRVASVRGGARRTVITHRGDNAAR